MLNLETISLETIAESWQARGFSFGSWEDFPNTLWENIVHDNDELFMVVSGEIELELAGKCQRIQPGEEVLIPAGIVRSKRILSPNGAQWLFGYRKNV
ncbi:MAG: cupin domain-containing protein [Gammaproteobacteria bacterium]|jgi:hypothetical protein